MNEAQLQASALLAMGEKPKDVAEKTGVSYQKVLQLKKAEEQSDVEVIDPAILHMVVEKAKEEAPAKVVKKLEKVAEGLTGLQVLDNEFHTTMSNVLKRANEFLDNEDLKAGEWVAITNALSNAYNNIFNNKGVSVNVNNGTQVSSNQLSMFKGSLRS
jgi:phage tail sheath protein FI